MAGLRGRGRRLDDVAPLTHLGAQREHTRGAVQRRFPRPHLDGRTGVLKAGERSRLIYRPRIQGYHRGAHRGFTWQDYRDLLVRAHLQLGGPIVVIWDNLNVHRCTRLREYAAEHAWLTIVQLPSYAPDLNPVEGIWSLLRRSTTANVVLRDRDHLVGAVRSGLRRIQRRPDLIEGCLAETGLSPDTTTQRKGQ